MFKINKEKILSAIKLKYLFMVNEKGERPVHPDMQCGLCGKIGITIGGGRDFEDGFKPVCEGCAIEEYQRQFKFVSKEAAAAHRRRFFDVSYLFGEMIIDKYLAENNLITFDDLTEIELEYLTRESALYFKIPARNPHAF